MTEMYLGIYNGKNKKLRRDGAEFRREAIAWCDAMSADGHDPKLCDVQDGRVRREIRQMPGLSVLCIFDHGTPKGLPRMRENLGNVKGLAATIAGVTDKITIILYACSCGKGWWWNKFRWLRAKKNKRDMQTMGYGYVYNPRDGYAFALCSELTKLGVEAEVWAHLTWGHCCRLPHVARIANFNPTESVHRERPVYPGTPEWKQWKRDLKGPLRFTFWRSSQQHPTNPAMGLQGY